MKTVLFSSSNGDVPADLAFINNYSATTNPGVGDDSADGYQVGSDWVNVTLDTAWKCVDATVGAAVWQLVGSAGEALAQFTAPAATSATGAGGTAFVKGGTGGTTAGNGGPSSVVGGAAVAGNSAGGIGATIGGAGQGTGTGGAANLTGGASGAGATGNGAPANVTGGAALSTNGSGGSAVLTGGAKSGTGIAGGVRCESILSQKQGAPTAKTVSATLTAAELLASIITVTQGGGAVSSQQLPTGTNLQNALPVDFAIDDSFDFSVINLGGASEVASITVNTDVTIVGNAAIPVPAVGVQSSGRFRCRKTADHVFVVYRIG